MFLPMNPLERGSKDLAAPARLHLFTPIFLHSALTDGSVDEPAEITRLKLPGRTLFFVFGRAFLDDPTGLLPLVRLFLS
jgi:hypothetical protein